MSFFEDTRSKWKARFKIDTPKKPNPYYQEYLNDKDKEFIRGWDYALKSEFPNFFDFIGSIHSDYKELGFDIDQIDTDVICSDMGYDDFSDVEKAGMPKETKILLMLADEFMHLAESSRDEIVTSMIESMDNDEYEDNFKKVWNMTPDEAMEYDFTDYEEDANNGKE